MNKLSIMTFTVVLFARSSLAVPGLDLLQKQIQNQLPQRPLVTHRTNRCVNFSGNWRGKCSVGEVTQEQSTVIHQEGCDAITIGSETLTLGGLDSRFSSNANAGKAYSTGVNMTTDWNSEQSAISTYVSGLIKVIGVEGAIPFTGKGVMKLDSAKLVNEIEMFGFKVNCVYDKQ